MFQYAAAARLARRHKTALLLAAPPMEGNRHSMYRLDIFRLNWGKLSNRYLTKISNILWRTKTYKNYSPGFHPEVLMLPRNSHVMGYFQSEKYFEDTSDCIRASFQRNRRTLPETTEEKNWRRQITESNSLCVHVRRGDFIGQNHQVCDASYYRRGVEWVRSRIPSTKIFLFSDEIDWCRAEFDWDNCQPVSLKSHRRMDDREFFLMTQCKHFVISNSSFSWWAAWLGERKKADSIVIMPGSDWQLAKPGNSPESLIRVD